MMGAVVFSSGWLFFKINHIVLRLLPLHWETYEIPLFFLLVPWEQGMMSLMRERGHRIGTRTSILSRWLLFATPFPKSFHIRTFYQKFEMNHGHGGGVVSDTSHLQGGGGGEARVSESNQLTYLAGYQPSEYLHSS